MAWRLIVVAVVGYLIVRLFFELKTGWLPGLSTLRSNRGRTTNVR